MKDKLNLKNLFTLFLIGGVWPTLAGGLIYFQFYSDLPIKIAVDFHTVEELESQKPEKPVFILFSAWWCGPCNRFKSEVLSKREIGLFLNEQFYPVLIEEKKDIPLTPKEEKYFKKFDIKAFPTIVVLDSKGRIIRYIEGGPDDLIAELSRDPETVRKTIHFTGYTPKTFRNPSKRPKLLYISYFAYSRCRFNYRFIREIDPFAVSSDAFARFVNNHFESYNFKPNHFPDPRQCVDVLNSLGVKEAPAVIVFDQEGNEVFRLSGNLSEFQARASEFLSGRPEKSQSPEGDDPLNPKR